MISSRWFHVTNLKGKKTGYSLSSIAHNGDLLISRINLTSRPDKELLLSETNLECVFLNQANILRKRNPLWNNWNVKIMDENEILRKMI